MKKVISVPARFFHDHWDRELFFGTVKKINSRFAHIEVDYDDIQQLIADAKYYWEERNFYRDYRDICNSAKRTIDRLAKLGYTYDPAWRGHPKEI